MAWPVALLSLLLQVPAAQTQPSAPQSAPAAAVPNSAAPASSVPAQSGPAWAAPVLPSLRLAPPRELHVGEHARLELEVSLPAEAASPLLLTPFREGQALEVVKGRLLRSDARDPAERPLHFELPVLARAPGVAHIGVRLLAYVCEPRTSPGAASAGAAPKSCRALEVETRADVLVLP